MSIVYTIAIMLQFMYIHGIYLVNLNFLYLYIVYLWHILMSTFSFKHSGQSGRLVLLDQRWACCARAAHHGVCVSCLAEFANGRIKGRVKSKVNKVSKKIGMRRRRRNGRRSCRRVEEDESDDDKDMRAHVLRGKPNLRRISW